MDNTMDSLKYFFEPRGFAVIGASHNPEKIGHTVLRNLVSGGFEGAIYPVSPKGGKIMGLQVYTDVREIKGPVDVASLCVPAQYAVQAVRDCGEKGVKYIQIITSGFSEIGNHKDEDEIVRIAEDYNMRVLGPNIFGMFYARSKMNSTFSATKIMPGRVAIVTQSGALGIAMIGKTAVENIGLSAIISTGNKCDIDEADIIEYLVNDESTNVILMYIEGIKKGERLIEILKKTSRIKPVIVIKSGRSKRGAMAAASHTGSLAGSDKIFDAIMRQCGVLRAATLEEAFNWAKYLAFAPEPPGDNGVIVTNGGGIGVLATDSCEKFDIPLFDNQEILKEVFEPATPSFGSTKNPVDITGGARAADYDLALSAPATSTHLDSTIALYCETATFDSENLTPMIRQTYQKHFNAGKPITYAIVGGAEVEKALIKLRRDNIPVFNDVEPAVSCLGAAYRFSRIKKTPADAVEEPLIDIGRIENVIDGALEAGRTFLLAGEGTEVMRAAGIPMPESRIAANITEAVEYAEEIGYPLVMKVVSRDILHKSDAGGVALNLENRDEVIEAYEAIMQSCMRYNPDAVIDGIELAEMAAPGVEVVVGAIRDASFGPVVMCGLGGIYVEVMKDVNFRSYPIGRKGAMDMVRELRSYPLLLGVRGEKMKDIDGVIDSIIKVGTILKQCERITDIEINPIVVYERSKGLKALDIRILVKNL